MFFIISSEKGFKILKIKWLILVVKNFRLKMQIKFSDFFFSSKNYIYL